MKKYMNNPSAIETRSFEIIEEEIIRDHGGYEFHDRFHEHIMKRVIHTSADFTYLDTLVIENGFTQAMVKALEDKCTIYTDTNMALSGISKRNLRELEVNVRCLIAEKEVADYARVNSMTRSMAAVDIAFETPGDKIFVLGNAPTALYRIMEHIESGNSDVRCIVAVPVGFVGAFESKDELHRKCKVPYITSLTRKGGSNVAAAIVNAVTYEMLK